MSEEKFKDLRIHTLDKEQCWENIELSIGVKNKFKALVPLPSEAVEYRKGRDKMKSKTKVISIILSISVLMMLVSCQKQKAEWKGKIEEVDGVTVVKNPKEPMYGEEACSLEEELSIGEPEGKEEYVFYRILMDVDEYGNMYILDAAAPNIRVFDKEGNYTQTIGRKGQGPGEMLSPRSIQITPQNEILVYDLRNQRFSFYSLTGEFLKQSLAATALFLLNPKMDSTGYVIGGILQRESYALNKFDLELNPVLTIYTIDIPSLSRTGELEVMIPSFSFDLTKKDNIVCGYNDKYEFQIIDSQGKLIRKIIKEYDPLEVSEKDKEEYIDRYTGGRGLPPDLKLQFPKYNRPFSSISVDEEDRIFVRTPKRVNGREGSFYYDVFDAEGKCLAEIPIEMKNELYPLIFKNNKLYIIDKIEEGYQVVKRYKVTWKY